MLKSKPISHPYTNSYQHVALLMGGLSAERDVSFMSGKAIHTALTTLGYHVTPIDMNRQIASTLEQLKPDVVFNALHGTYGEDGCIPGLLEIMGIPYTHSGVKTSAIAMDKNVAKTIFIQAGIDCPPGSLFSYAELLSALPSLAKPYVIKPVSEGSSVGVIIVKEQDTPPNADLIYPAPYYLVERYIPGIELSVAVIDEGPLGVMELEPLSDFYDYTHKYTANTTNHYVPARIERTVYEQAMDMAYKAHTLLDCAQISRSDFRFDPNSGKLYLLELNTHPGMTPLSIVPEIAASKGISFETLIQYLLENASCQK